MKAIYVSYDGVLDTVGASQVIPYLLGLADGGSRITLISFEKRVRWENKVERERVRALLQGCGIKWRPRRYHRRPRAGATLLDMVAGSWAIASEMPESAPAVVHCRGDIATAMARWARLPSSVRLVYDVRGFFADERVETGSWRRGSLVDRAVRRIETRNLRRADGAVVLTRHAAERLRERRPSLELIRIIPTCADLSVFKPAPSQERKEFGFAYSGSLGTWYMAEEMVAFVRSAQDTIRGRALFLTPQADELRRLVSGTDSVEIRAVEPRHVAGWLRRAVALSFFIRPVPSKRASCPTKFAEALACGLPVVCNRGIGDLDDIVEREGVGVLVDGFSEPHYVRAAGRLKHLLREPDLSDRCRRLAESRYSVDIGVTAYRRLYEELAGTGRPSGETGERLR
jgi:glycosyltransferase involved in cell wall biosynthesis